MSITLTHLGPTLFAEASHEEVARSVLSDGGIEDVENGTKVLFDARFLLLDPADVARVAFGGRLCTPDGAVVLEVAGADHEVLVHSPPVRSPLLEGRAERRHVDRLLSRLQGVILHDPDRIWIGAEVRIDPGAVIWGGAVLRGTTHVGAAHIGPGAILVDTRVADGATVKPYTVCQQAHIGPDAIVGPMAHLRPKARLSFGVKVGNFVEVKNTTLHANAKASHLSYLGDAEIGAGANIGAGTITCNYDGFNKWRTVIGPGAFIGSNSALVAPVTIHEGAIVAAGSTINQDVPADALALSRADQKNLPKMGARIRRKNQNLKERNGG